MYYFHLILRNIYLQCCGIPFKSCPDRFLLSFDLHSVPLFRSVIVSSHILSCKHVCDVRCLVRKIEIRWSLASQRLSGNLFRLVTVSSSLCLSMLKFVKVTSECRSYVVVNWRVVSLFNNFLWHCRTFVGCCSSWLRKGCKERSVKRFV